MCASVCDYVICTLVCFELNFITEFIYEAMNNYLSLQGGIQNNVIPEKLSASFDLRLALSVNFEEFENMV